MTSRSELGKPCGLKRAARLLAAGVALGLAASSSIGCDDTLPGFANPPLYDAGDSGGDGGDDDDAS